MEKKLRKKVVKKAKRRKKKGAPENKMRRLKKDPFNVPDPVVDNFLESEGYDTKEDEFEDNAVDEFGYDEY